MLATSVAVPVYAAMRASLEREAGERNLLTRRYSSDVIASSLAAGAEWSPFPKASDRAKWSALAEDARQAFTTRGTEALKKPWQVLTAIQFLEYKRNGNRSRFEAVQFSRRYKLRDLVLAECMAGDGRFLDEIANGVWLTCEETFWGLPAHLSPQKAGSGLPDPTEPIVDLFAAETASMLAWTDYLLGERFDDVSKLIRPRVRAEVERRILQPALARNFGWMGLGERARDAEPPNNWNPWICSNWLTSSLLLDHDKARRIDTTEKVLRCLDQFLNGYGDDGGCNEGPTYWNRAGGSLFDCLEVLYFATKGKVDVYSEALIRNMGAYIYRAHVASDYYLNFGDAPARAKLPGPLIFAYGHRTKDKGMQAFGAWLAQQQENGVGTPESIGRGLGAIFGLSDLRAQPASQTLLEEAWLPDLQQLAVRSRAGSLQGLYLGAKGGRNKRSHGHNDAGNFVLFADGKPILVDAGVGTYTAQTFSARRYEIWTMQSAFHNLPTIGGVMQSAAVGAGATDVRYSHTGGARVLQMNLATAYPPEANVQRWQRTFHFEPASNRLTLRDEFALSKVPENLMLSLMTPCAVDAAGDLVFRNGDVNVKAAMPKGMAAKVEPIELTDERLRGVWGDKLCRVVLTVASPPAKGSWELVFERA